MAKKRKGRSAKEEAEYFTQPADGVRWIKQTPVPEPAVTTEELIRMSIDITNGAVKPPSSFDADHRRAWATLLREISEISARGGIVDLPSEIV